MDVKARYYCQVQDPEALSELQLHHALPVLVLGGGSNILFTQDFEGYVLHNKIGGIEKIKEDDTQVWIRAGAGVDWHGFVEYCIEQGFAGVENLALIPGFTGASPIQNIGAYGVEVKEVIDEVEAWHLKDKCKVTFSAADCSFGYRDSVFKSKFKGQFMITAVTYRLRKQPIFHTGYGAIQEELDRMGITQLSIRAIADAVIRIRRSKLPDPAQIGNAGSFFKNPEVSAAAFASLQVEHPGIIGFPVSADRVKLAAGWLIEKAGWKGYTKGDAGVHHKQALVLVNHGNATGREIYDLSTAIQESVQQRFRVTLEREVNIY